MVTSPPAHENQKLDESCHRHIAGTVPLFDTTESGDAWGEPSPTPESSVIAFQADGTGRNASDNDTLRIFTWQSL